MALVLALAAGGAGSAHATANSPAVAALKAPLAAQLAKLHAALAQLKTSGNAITSPAGTSAAGGTFPGQGLLPSRWHHPHGEAGDCGGGPGGASTTRIPVAPGAGSLSLVRGTDERAVAPAGKPGGAEITW